MKRKIRFNEQDPRTAYESCLMKIADVQTIVVGNPPPAFGGRYFIFVKVTTACGIVGWGEVYGASFRPHLMAKLVEDLADRQVIGQDPFNIERMWRRVHGEGFSMRPDPTVMGCFSGIEMALMDICGKAVGKPVHALLGGLVNERLRAYTYIYPDLARGQGAEIYGNAELSAERAVDYLAMGFTALKFDPAGPYSAFDPRQPSPTALDRSEKFCRLMREAVGSRADLLFGTHGQFTSAGAIRLAKRLEPYEPLWLEEPTTPEMPEEMARVAAATSIPVAAGERLTTKYEFQRLLATGAARILQPNMGRVGGLWEAKKIAALAEVHYAQIAPHMYCGPVVAAANIQLAASIPNFLILECIERMDGIHAKLLKKPLHFEEGYIIPSREPGLGVEVDEAVARSLPYTGHGLHLNVDQQPVDFHSQSFADGGDTDGAIKQMGHPL